MLAVEFPKRAKRAESVVVSLGSPVPPSGCGRGRGRGRGGGPWRRWVKSVEEM